MKDNTTLVSIFLIGALLVFGLLATWMHNSKLVAEQAIRAGYCQQVVATRLIWTKCIN
jgi:hypothetical protein